MQQGFPQARAGQVIGLLGGSFDPAHAGHVHLTRHALKRFGLDRVWWLVSPGNPIKCRGPAPIGQRLAAARSIMVHPRVRITDLEARLGSRKTAHTLARLQRLYPGVRFVWLMGADNLAQLHRWHDWRSILHRVPVGVLARPEARMPALNSPAARIYRDHRVPESSSTGLGHRAAPAWCFVNMPMREQSSTAIRKMGGWGGSDQT